MSERSEAPRSGGRSAQSRTTAGGPGRMVSRDADTGAGARGARRSEGADTRRSGMRGRGASATAAPVDGATALSIEVAGDAPPITNSRPRLWVAPPLPIRAPRATFAAAVIAMVLFGVVGILLVNTKTMEQSFRLDALRKEKSVLDKQQQELERQLVEASGPGNLTAAARRLGLVPAENPAVIWLPDGNIIGPPTPGKGPTSPTAGDGLNSKTSTSDEAAAKTPTGTANDTGTATGGATTGGAADVTTTGGAADTATTGGAADASTTGGAADTATTGGAADASTTGGAADTAATSGGAADAKTATGDGTGVNPAAGGDLETKPTLTTGE